LAGLQPYESRAKHPHMNRPFIVIGTRPEAIKLAPVVRASRERMEAFVCVTGQHGSLVEAALNYFEIRPDIALEAHLVGTTLTTFAASCIGGLEGAIDQIRPDCVVAQGDTTSVFCAAVAAFYRRLPFVHVEAGLRTGNLDAPFPEEFNRRVASLAATLHCAPTLRAAENLRHEGVMDKFIYVTGNTVVDALQWTIARERENPMWPAKYRDLGERLILITAHRRENFGESFSAICDAVAALALHYPDLTFLWAVHPNPQARPPKIPGVRLIDPPPYPEWVWLMNRCDFILTDSGGIQEEAAALGKRCLVLRDTTERPEAIECGAARLVGTDPKTILSVARSALDGAAWPMNGNPFGDGKAAERIVDLLLRGLPSR
jgi:UDP-N-acetylglucosamine 2-epimerase (non-hydrolysing)